MTFSISYIIHLKAVSVHLTYSVARHHLKVRGKMPKIIIVERTTSKLSNCLSGLCFVASKRAWQRACRLLTLLDVLVLLHHLFAHRSRQSLHYRAHDAEVGHVVDVTFVRLGGDGVQLVFIGILHAWKYIRLFT